MEDLAGRLGASYHPDPMVFPKIGQPGSADSIRIDDEQFRQLIKHGDRDNVDTGPIKNELSRHLLCSAARTRCAISPHGEVFPCGLWRIPLGNLRQQKFEDIWHGENASKIRAITVNDFPECAKCELVYYCARCPGLVHMENSGFLGPSSENCRLARALKGVRHGRD